MSGRGHPDLRDFVTSIPFISGQCVIKQPPSQTPFKRLFQSPLYRVNV